MGQGLGSGFEIGFQDGVRGQILKLVQVSGRWSGSGSGSGSGFRIEVRVRFWDRDRGKVEIGFQDRDQVPKPTLIVRITDNY